MNVPLAYVSAANWRGRGGFVDADNAVYLLFTHKCLRSPEEDTHGFDAEQAALAGWMDRLS